MDFELLEWKIDSDIITFGSLPETDTSFVRFESIDMYMQSLSAQLENHLGTKVEINTGKKDGTGKMTISFYDHDQFEGILDKLQFRPVS